MKFLLVGIGGFIGSCLRYSMNRLFAALNMQFPLSTLVCNATAGLLIGISISLESEAGLISPKTKLLLNTGLLGGLSTFSAFSAETVAMFVEGKYLHAAGNVLLNVSLSLLGVFAGMTIIKTIIGRV